MPFVNVKVIQGVFDGDQKREIVARLPTRWTSTRWPPERVAKTST